MLYPFFFPLPNIRRTEQNNSLHDNINFPWICDNESFRRLDDVVSSRWCVCLCHFRPHPSRQRLSVDKNFCDLTLSRDWRWKSLKLSLHITAMRRSKSQEKFVFRFSFCSTFGIITEASARSRSATCDANNFSNDKAKLVHRWEEQSEAKRMPSAWMFLRTNSSWADYNSSFLSLALCALTNKASERTWNCQMYNLIIYTFLSFLTINWMENYIRTAASGVSEREEVKATLWNTNEHYSSRKAHMLHDDDELKGMTRASHAQLGVGWLWNGIMNYVCDYLLAKAP